MAPIHILILGGDVKFLPVAKSKVRALADRLGPDGYGSEKILIEGTTIMVEVQKGIQRITMTGTGGLFMDTGAVDIQTLTLGDPTLGQTDGVLHYNTVQRASEAQSQLLGTLKVPSTASKPTPDGTVTPAFKARVRDDARLADSEVLLAAKKACSKLAPPSQFTGKMRLFFQAKYGQNLDDWLFTVNTTNEPPSLDAVFKTVPFQFHPGLCGIYTDTTKRHWLVQIGMDGQEAFEGITIHQLTAPSAAEGLRKLLLDGDRTADERERIEAYILSASTPGIATKVQLPMNIPARTSMGYGWHFNWSGTNADIVAHGSSEFGSGLQYHATHYRLRIQLSDTGLWEAGIETLETATWGNNKWKTVIAYPDWQSQELSIFGSTLGLKSATNAPVYCFWRRQGDEEVFEIIRYTYDAGRSGVRGEYISNPPYYRGMVPEAPGAPTVPPCATSGVSIGLEATRADSITYNETATSSSFASTTETLSTSYRSSTSSATYGTEKTATKSTLLSGPSIVGPQGIYDVMPGSMPVFPGDNFCPTGPASGSGNLREFTPFGGSMNVYYSRVTWTRYTLSDVNTEDIATVLVIPFGDAEAVYMHAKKYRNVTSTRIDSRLMDSTVADIDFVRYYTITSGPDTFEWFNFGSGIDSDHIVASAVADGTVTSTPEDQRWTVVGSKCISNAGALDIDWTPSNAFFAGDPAQSVSEQLLTLTSASGDIKGQEIDLTGGYPVAINTAPSVFIGWA